MPQADSRRRLSATRAFVERQASALLASRAVHRLPDVRDTRRCACFKRSRAVGGLLLSKPAGSLDGVPGCVLLACRPRTASRGVGGSAPA
jgi:hypothetical protein